VKYFECTKVDQSIASQAFICLSHHYIMNHLVSLTRLPIRSLATRYPKFLQHTGAENADVCVDRNKVEALLSTSLGIDSVGAWIDC
jgi:hypothetical protein